MKRRYLGMDILPDAVQLAQQRLQARVRTDSALLSSGHESELDNNPWLDAHLAGFSSSHIQRNAGADAILKDSMDGKTVFMRVQPEGETLLQAAFAMRKTLASKGAAVGVILATGTDLFTFSEPGIRILPPLALQMKDLLGPVAPAASRTALGTKTA